MKKWLIIAACLGAAGAAAGMYLHAENDDSATSDLPTASGGFSGIVTNGATGKPLAGARVAAVNQATNEVAASTESSESGAFALDLPDGDYVIRATADHFVAQGKLDNGREILVHNDTRYVNARIDLWPASSMHGRVVSGNAGIQAEIELHYESDSSGAGDYIFKTIESGADGRFIIGEIYAGTASVAISAEGFTTAHLADIHIQPGESIELGDIPMRDGITLYGRITDASSTTGIDGAEITVRNARNQIIARCSTDHDGNYRMRPIETARVMIEVSAEGYYVYRQRMAVGSNARQEASFKLDRAWGLMLDIQNQTGRDPSHTLIRITDISSSQVVYEHTLSNGKISLDSLKAGPYIIEASTTDRVITQTVRANAGQSMRIVLKPLAIIHAHAQNSNGEPLQSGEYRYIARLNDSPDDTETPWTALVSPDIDLDELPAGTYRLELRTDNTRIVSSPEFVLKNGDVRDMVIRMTEGGVLQGRVVSTESGIGIDATVELVADKPRTVKTDNEGNFTIDKLPQTAFSIVISPDRDEGSKTFENIQVKDNETISRTFSVDAPNADRRAKRRAMRENWRNNGGQPPWGDGKPPWGDGPPPAPPWGDGKPPWGDGPPPAPPWGDGKPPWGDGPPPAPPWGDGKPPWGDGSPQWQNQPNQNGDAPAAQGRNGRHRWHNNSAMDQNGEIPMPPANDPASQQRDETR